MNHDIEWWRVRKHQRSAEFTKPSFQTISIDGGFAVFRDDETDTSMLETRKGSDSPNIEVFGSESLPYSCDAAQMRATRNAASALKRLGLTRRRTCSGAAR